MSDFYRRVYGGMADGTLDVQKRPNNQRGNGFFGRMIKGSLAPLIRSVLPYLKDVALEGVGGLVNDLKEGKSVKEAAATQLKRTTSTLVDDMAKRVRRSVSQAGAGVKRRRPRQKRKRPTRQRKRATPAARKRGLFSA